MQGPLGHCGDDQVVVVHALLVIDGGGQGVLAAAGHLDALVEPQAVDGILAGDVRAAQGQLDVPGGELGGGVPQGDGHSPPLRQAHPHLAVVIGAAFLTGAVIDISMLFGPLHNAAVVFAYAAVGDAVAVGRVDHVVMAGVILPRNQLGRIIQSAIHIGADVGIKPLFAARGLLNYGIRPVYGAACRAFHDVQRPRSGGQGHRHDQRQQGSQGSVNSLFHI